MKFGWGDMNDGVEKLLQFCRAYYKRLEDKEDFLFQTFLLSDIPSVSKNFLLLKEGACEEVRPQLICCVTFRMLGVGLHEKAVVPRDIFHYTAMGYVDISSISRLQMNY